MLNNILQVETFRHFTLHYIILHNNMITVLWDVTECDFVNKYQCSRLASCLYLQSTWSSADRYQLFGEICCAHLQGIFSLKVTTIFPEKSAASIFRVPFVWKITL
jgi:hypothetical protein